MLDLQRQKELSGMRPGKLREDKIILLNIKGKEKDNSKVRLISSYNGKQHKSLWNVFTATINFR